MKDMTPEEKEAVLNKFWSNYFVTAFEHAQAWSLQDVIEAGFMDKETYQNMLFMIASAIKKMPEWEEKEKLKSEFDELKKSEKKEK